MSLFLNRRMNRTHAWGIVTGTPFSLDVSFGVVEVTNPSVGKFVITLAVPLPVMYRKVSIECDEDFTASTSINRLESTDTSVVVNIKTSTTALGSNRSFQFEVRRMRS